jgi:hypothetical protein
MLSATKMMALIGRSMKAHPNLRGLFFAVFDGKA